jgi:hypothetical protein
MIDVIIIIFVFVVVYEESRVQQLQAVCQQFFEQITSSLSSVPYGLRLICKQLNTLCQERFPKAPKEDIYKVLGYVVYYRFMNPYITQPDSFENTNQELTLTVRKNLIIVSEFETDVSSSF